VTAYVKKLLPALGLVLFVCGWSVGQAQSPAAVSPGEKRVALVIGNDTYQHAPRLRNAANDANDLGASLTGLGFDTEVVLNADQRGMEDRVRPVYLPTVPGLCGIFPLLGARLAGRSGKLSDPY
jgi:hypothetical protein